MAHVEDHPQPFALDLAHRRRELVAAVAPCRVKHIARQALAVSSYQHVLLTGYLAFDQGQVMLADNRVAVHVQRELAERRGKVDRLYVLD